MREAIRASGDLGRRRVEENELRQSRKQEMKRDAAEGEKKEDEQEPAIGGSEMRVHRFIEFGHEQADGGELAMPVRGRTKGHSLSPAPGPLAGDQMQDLDFESDHEQAEHGHDRVQEEALEPAPTTPAQGEDDGYVCSPTEVAESVDGDDIRMNMAEVQMRRGFTKALPGAASIKHLGCPAEWRPRGHSCDTQTDGSPPAAIVCRAPPSAMPIGAPLVGQSGPGRLGPEPASDGIRGRQSAEEANRTVNELYSPPRVTAMAQDQPQYGIASGFALDLTTGWNFDSAERRRAARELIRVKKPMLIVGCPMCARFCTFQHINDMRRTPEEVRRSHLRAMVHLRFMSEIYKEQVDAKRYFLHEHPGGATSWAESSVPVFPLATVKKYGVYGRLSSRLPLDPRMPAS